MSIYTLIDGTSRRINASPEEVAKAVMRRVEVIQVSRPKAQSG